MVKFGKQLEGSLVQEWKDAYCNYKELKRDVKRIKQDRLNSSAAHNHHVSRNGPNGGGGGGGVGVLRSLGSISSLHNFGAHLRASVASGTAGQGFSLGGGGCTSGDAFVVHNNSEPWNDVRGSTMYKSNLMEVPRCHPEQDQIFFNRLDTELSKINGFYSMKEAEYIAQATRLENQLLSLFEVQEALARQSVKMGAYITKLPDHHGITVGNSSDEELNFGISSSAMRQEDPLMEHVITVKSDDNEFFERRKFDEELSTSDEEFGANSSSDEEMEIIASFIENVEVTDTPHEAEINSNLKTRGHHRKTPSWTNNWSKSAPSPDRENGADAFAMVVHESANGHADGTASPFNAVKRKGEFRARLRKVRETLEHQKIQEQHPAPLRRPKSNIIQDMIDMSLSKKKIQNSEKMLRTAFIEFYRGLGMLQSYTSLNLVAFAKIMKKYDKVVKHKLRPLYLKEVERTYFASSDEVAKLMAKVEDIFTKHFSDHDRRKAMAQLRPLQQRGGHSITFFLGIFAGSSLALFIGLLVLLATKSRYRTVGGDKYMDTVFHVFSMLGLVLLHMYMYGWNVYAWQRTRINYPFIFEFSPGSELRYREVLLVCTGFTSLLLGTTIAHIIASSKQAPNYISSEFAPMGIFLVFLVSLLTPLNILYRASRIFFLRCMQHIIFAPFYKVVLADFFLGDQLTSQVASFRNLEFMICYYSGGYFQKRDPESCGDHKLYRELMYVFSLLPYWFRFAQCMRRWRDEGDKMQLYNAGKYGSAMLAVVMKLSYATNQSTVRLVMFILASCFATSYQLYWDLVVDWGLLQRNSKNRWLRDSLVLKRKYLYFISMVVNAILRLAWISSIQHMEIPGFSQAGWDIIFAALEVIRRGQWNFYRLENEHLNNVGKFRAVKNVPLPFKEFEGATL